MDNDIDCPIAGLEPSNAAWRAWISRAAIAPAQPVIPDEITSASAPEVFEIAAEAERLGIRGTYGSYAVGWNACRAEMLKAQPVSEPYKLEIDMDDADHFSITHLHEIIYGKELIWPEAKLLARFMLDVKQRVSAAPAQESE